MELTVIGIDNSTVQRESEAWACFGKCYSKRAPECRRCIAPVVADGQVFLMREVCEQATLGSRKAVRTNHLTTQEIMTRLQAGKSLMDVFVEMLQGGDIDVVGRETYRVLYGRIKYIEKKGVPVPALSPFKEMRENVPHNEAS